MRMLVRTSRCAIRGGGGAAWWLLMALILVFFNAHLATSAEYMADKLGELKVAKK